MRATRRWLKLVLLSRPLLIAGCSVSPPGTFEAGVAHQIKHRLSIRGVHDKNPFPATETNIKAGEQEFQNSCTSCHGPDGKNTSVIFADKMSPPVPMLNSSEVQEYSDGQLKWVIANGIFPSG